MATPAVPLGGRLRNLGLLFALRRAAGTSAGVPGVVQAKLTINPPDDIYEQVANASMDLVAPGGGLAQHTENQDVFSYVQRELHKRGWTVIEIHGEGPIKAFIPDSIPTPGDESFADEAFYTYGLMAFRPSR